MNNSWLLIIESMVEDDSDFTHVVRRMPVLFRSFVLSMAMLNSIGICLILQLSISSHTSIVICPPNVLCTFLSTSET